MDSKYIVKSNGLYFVEGKAFIASKNDASVLCRDRSQDVADSATNLGLEVEVEPVIEKVVSFAVNYIRKGDVNADGSVDANRRNPSKRRFATKDEAVQHGSRFGERRAKAGDDNGTAGHVGFWVSESFDAVNAAINWKTGLTNSI